MIYLDNAATTYPKPNVLYEKTMEIYSEIGLNASRGKYDKANDMKQLVLGLKKNLSNLFSNQKDLDIILNSSATISLNQIIQGLDYSNIKHVYISPFEHNSVYIPLIEMQKRYEFEIIVIPFDKFFWDRDKTKLFFENKKPDVVISTHASNVFGNILPIKDLFNLSKECNKNSINILDAAQSSGLLNIDVDDFKIDFLVFAGHKTLYGPSGIGGFIYNNKKINLRPLIFGGTGINSEELEMPNILPERFEVGSLNSLGVIGLKLSTDWLLETGIKNILKKEKENYFKLLDVLEMFENIKIYKPKESIGIVSITSFDYSPGELGDMLNEYGIAVRVGLHCSPLAHKHLITKPNGTVRFSISYFNNETNFEELRNVLEEIL